MAQAIPVPRINNNDDEVKLVNLACARGDKVSQGQVVAQIESAKAVMDVVASCEGYVIDIEGELDGMVAVGSTLVWVGNTPDEVVPRKTQEAAPQARTAPTGRARLLLRQYGLTVADIVPSGDRLTVEDIERHVAQKNSGGRAPVAGERPVAMREPEIPGRRVPLRSDEAGMLQTVAWQREHATVGYVEIEYEASAWEAYAKDFAAEHKLMLSPLLSLMAWRLVGLARAQPKLNSTIVGNMRHEYTQVNLGFTVQAGETLYLCVQRDAGALDALAFVNALGELQRRAAVHKLAAAETFGATIAFSSMARWKVSRHIPVLAPDTSVMIAHAVSADGRAVLGASYDHRVINGFHAVSMLRKLATPPGREATST